ncbi:MAG: hypothetical protein K2O03_14525 [Lachnospiraceae bacterium]|nr:hypothetical protein [Lachnospiraceae bacterium]
MDNKNPKRKSVRAGGSSKGAVLFVLFLAAIMILTVAAFRVAADGKKPVNTHTPTATPVPTKVADIRDTRRVTAIMERVDMETKTLQLYSVQDQAVLWLSYESRTNIVDKYGLVIVAGQLSPGDILEVEYETQGSMAVSVAVSGDAWEHPYQTGLTVGTERQMLTAGGRNFIYSDALHIYSNGVEEELSYILKEDSITLRGIGSEVYVILLERGHGYLTLKEEQDYVGGSILANNQYISQITDDLMLTLKEGTYDITVENDDLRATIPVTIARDQTTVLDLTEYVRVPDPVGQVTFKIQPAGAVLWINDENRFYGEPVKLAYGVYKIRVESGGYVPYEGLLRVEGAASELAISLPEAPVATPTLAGELTPTPTPADGTGTGNDGSGGNVGGGTSSGDSQDNTSEQNPNGDGSYPVDEEHHIIIYSDDEVEIYLDGDYMGVTEDGKAEFEKFIGTFELELVLGEESKSYIIQVDDDGEDFIFRRYFE